MANELMVVCLKGIAQHKDKHGISLAEFTQAVGGQFTTEEVTAALTEAKSKGYAVIEVFAGDNDRLILHDLTAAGKFYLHRALRTSRG